MTSARRTVAVDADNVIACTTEPLLEFYRVNHDPASSITMADCHTYDLWNVWSCSREEAIEIVMEFFKTEHAMTSPPIPGAKEVLTSLRERYKLVVITARRDDFATMTLAWLDRFFSGIFEDVLFANHFTSGGHREVSKAELCLQVGAWVLIDDQIDHLTPCQKVGITGILFGQYPWQDAYHIPDGILRAKDWPAVLNLLTQ